MAQGGDAGKTIITDSALLFKKQTAVYFSFNELKCPCCNGLKINTEAFMKLYLARLPAAIPFPINSGYRCPKHNTKIGSSTDNHTRGMAFDIQCEDYTTRIIMIRWLMFAGFKRFGIHKTFIHVDSVPEKKPALWVYLGAKKCI